ncbi:PREDICTED: Na(+)/H(+) exchange regulatory cofactor NHE-RF1 [Nanorana parkeri]|uniref:Na(+)/H(+) exchange regulatory cofactor NHE-RF1 n=1 Tax=Nanorana parkeri TaxID=125878 RepID=UPI000854174E|nr:PREDICTED: Na(+)/H(+) exchange regulatory cofactor NHE-RF1 [Nanorana parkeri]
MAPEKLCVLEKGPSGYGFHLHSEKNRPGQYVKLVEPGSPADKAGLKAGDRLIRVCGEDVRELGHQQVVGKIRAATEQLTLEVQGPEEQAEDTSQIDKQPAASNNEQLSQVDAPDRKFKDALQEKVCRLPLPSATRRFACNTRNLVVVTGTGMHQQQLKVLPIEKKEFRPRLCIMKKGPNGYGFNLHSDKSQPGQYIRAVDPDSPAELAGLLPKDRIIEVNGESMLGKQHGEVVLAIKAAGEEATMLVVDPETELYFQECHVTPGREHLSGPLPDKVVNGGLEKENKPEHLENDSPRDSLISNPEPEPLENPPQLEAQKVSDSAPVPASDPIPSIETLDLNVSLAAAKERAHQKRSQKKAPTMDWNKRKEVFGSL